MANRKWYDPAGQASVIMYTELSIEEQTEIGGTGRIFWQYSFRGTREFIRYHCFSLLSLQNLWIIAGLFIILKKWSVIGIHLNHTMERQAGQTFWLTYLSFVCHLLITIHSLRICFCFFVTIQCLVLFDKDGNPKYNKN